MSEVPPSSSSAAAAAAAEAEVMELSEAAPASSSVFSLSQPFSAGVERDVRVLVTRVVALFDELEGLRFQHFLDIWKDMRFPLIFCGRQYARELYELTEEVLACAKRRALAPESQPVRAAAVYLTYALYFRQPLRPRIKVRLTLPELRDVSEFIDRCREEQHWDLVYVWARLLQDHAFEFVACGGWETQTLFFSQQILLTQNLLHCRDPLGPGDRASGPGLRPEGSQKSGRALHGPGQPAQVGRLPVRPRQAGGAALQVPGHEGRAVRVGLDLRPGRPRPQPQLHLRRLPRAGPVHRYVETDFPPKFIPTRLWVISRGDCLMANIAHPPNL